MRKESLIRLVVTVVLLYFARKSLVTWYIYQLRSDYFLFLLFVLLALASNILKASHSIRSLVRETSRGRWFLAAVICVLTLPWPDWLQKNEMNLGATWHLELLDQAFLLYVAVVALNLFPSVRNKLASITGSALTRLAAFRWISAGLCVLFFCVCCGIAFFVYDKTILNTDSGSHYFQAKIFSRYAAYAPAPIPPDFFSLDSDELVVKDGRWFGMFLPGFALLLAAAKLLHAEWFLNPLLGALSIAIWAAYARRWYGNRPALLLTLFAITSPFLLTMSSALMVHTPELFIASATIYISRREMEQTSRYCLAALFVTMVAAILVRGFSILPLLTPVLAYVCWQKMKNRSFAFPAVVATGIVCGAILLGLYNWRTTADPLLPGYALELNMKYGFGEKGGRIHTVARGFENSSLLLLGLNQWLTGWHVGSILFLVYFVVVSKEDDHWDRLLFYSSAILFAFYFFFYFLDLIYGPRFLFPISLFLLLYLARHISIHPLITCIFVLSLLVSPFLRLPRFLRNSSPEQFQNGPLQSEINRLGERKTLVFLRPEINQEFLNWNDPFLTGPVILCRDLGERNPEAIAAFPDYAPAYFGLQIQFEKTMMIPDYKITAEVVQTTTPLSLMQLAMFLKLSQDQTRKDIFDLQYAASSSPSHVVAQLHSLQEREKDRIEGAKSYAIEFRTGLMRTARLLLAPRIAYYESGQNWSSTLDWRLLKSDLQEAIVSFDHSGNIGQPVSGALIKVFKRIDKNSDQQISNSELHAYIDKKIAILKAREYSAR